MFVVQKVRTGKTPGASAFLMLAAAWGSVPGAQAAASAWHREEGGAVRLLAAGKPDASGRLRGALEIELAPGWKTYWRDPGTAGVPPSIDVSGSANVAGAVLDFPVPQRHDDGYGAWAGYAASVTLPVTFTLDDAAKPADIKADVFLGLCRDICVPVSAKFELDTGEPDAAADEAAVDAAFAGLPAAASNESGVAVEAVTSDKLLLSARLPGKADREPQLFVAGENGFVFGVPAAEKTDAGWRFAVPLLDRPKAKGTATPVFYTLEAGGKAVSGTFDLP